MFERLEIGDTMTIKSKTVDREKIQLLNEAYLFVDTYSKELYSYAVWLCGNERLAQKAIENANDQIIEKIHSKAKFNSIKTTFLNAIKSYCKQKDIASINSTQQKKPNYDQGTLSLLIRKVLRKVPERYSEPLVIQVLGSLSVTEIASFFDISEDEIKMRLSAARKIVSALVALELSLPKSQEIYETDMKAEQYCKSFLNNHSV